MDLKSTFESLKGKATDLAQAGVAQSKRLAEIAKLKTANMAEEDSIKKAYLELGKLYYAEHGATPDGAYVAACERITASKALIETNNERIAELKQSVSPEDAEVEEASADDCCCEEAKEEASAGSCCCEEAKEEASVGGCCCEEAKEEAPAADCCCGEDKPE